MTDTLDFVDVDPGGDLVLAQLEHVLAGADLDQPDLDPLEAPEQPPPHPLSPVWRRLALAAVGLAVVAVLAAGYAITRPTPENGPPSVAFGISLPTATVVTDGPVEVVALDHGSAVRVDLFVDGDWVSSDGVAPYAPSWDQRDPGRHELKAKVTDDDGNVRYSEPAYVIIDP